MVVKHFRMGEPLEVDIDGEIGTLVLCRVDGDRGRVKVVIDHRRLILRRKAGQHAEHGSKGPVGRDPSRRSTP